MTRPMATRIVTNQHQNKLDQLGERHGGKLIFLACFLIVTCESLVEWLL